MVANSFSRPRPFYILQRLAYCVNLFAGLDSHAIVRRLEGNLLDGRQQAVSFDWCSRVACLLPRTVFQPGPPLRTCHNHATTQAEWYKNPADIGMISANCPRGDCVTVTRRAKNV